MDNWCNQYQEPTVDFPLAVHYYKPSVLSTELRANGRHPDLEFAMVHRGRVLLRIQEQELVLEPGQIVVINPNELHGYRSLTLDVIELTVRFPVEMLQLPENNFFYQEFVKPVRDGLLRLPRILTSSHPAYASIYEALCRFHPQKDGQPGYRQTQLAAVFQACCALSAFLSPVQPRNKIDGLVETCTHYLCDNYRQKLTLHQIAEAMGVHPNYLCNRFKEATGQTVFEYLTNFRLEKAWRLLGHANLPLGEVCSRCGFNNMGYFNRKFTERYGLSPREHKKDYKTQNT